ncbi:methyltransferase domain-containing protein [Pseudoruegeria sp. SHC-113]|uniref:methyltransferase domain-containing protein n=1 Tax=Pseudoruegeria sp. SHC-113 TaxID=2855439 RepID=UPI0021BAF0C2|nr:methyltransferase domain-containing protein [Pseudoruegeria sp. SHC-113]MCT8160218.1 methyltransferase domain-containing protein [Pseudoruegeria sp. SHC-113]
MIEFDAETTRLLDSVYQGADVTRRRRGGFDALQPGPGETIVDIGCGNGLLSLELGRAVGPVGRVIGVDPSSDMRKSASNRCAEHPWVDIRHGTAEEIPVETGAADKAVSVQVYEYLADIPAALEEAHRILKPGGRLVIGDIHFDSLAWHSDAPERMARMITAWDRHFVERRVPALLPPLLRDAGFEVEQTIPVPVCDTQLRPDGLANMMIILMQRFAENEGLIPAQEARDWALEQRQLAESGRFFFSLTHFVTRARKPA